MKKSFKFLMMSALLLAGFSSCSNDDSTDNAGQEKSVFVKIETGNPSTYGEGSAVTTGTVATLTTADLYFATATGAIIKHMTISSAATSATNINLTEITTTGYTATTLPGTVSDVFVVANKASLPTSGNISAVKTTMATIESQTNTSTYGIEQAVLYGTNGLTLVAGSSYKSDITIKPLISRIEIANITAYGDITDYKLEGIFINNYYSQARLDGTRTVVTDNLVNNGTTIASYVSGTSQYPTTLPLFDYNATTGLGVVGLVKAPAAGKVWAYNVFAASTKATVPHIVLRLSNIVDTKNAFVGTTQFVTVKGFYEADGTTPITTFEAGKIYKLDLSSLKFNETHLTPNPEMATIDVAVKVIVLPWTVKVVTPEI